MNTDILKTYKTVHTWVGLTAGMLLFIGFFAGALTMFKEPLARWAAPEYNPAAPYRVSIDQLPRLIGLTQAHHPATMQGFTLHLAPDENTPASLTWEEARAHAGEHVSRHFNDNRHFWSGLNADGALESGEFKPSQMAELIDLLHRTAGIPGEGHHLWGVNVMGVVCLLYGLALLSGLILLLPTFMRDLLAMRRGNNRKRFWLDAHNAIGITSLPFHLVMAVTVVVFAFHDVFYDSLQLAVYGDKPLFPRNGTLTPAEPAAPLTTPRQVIDNLHQLDPRLDIKTLHYQGLGQPGASLRISGRIEGELMRGGTFGVIQANPYTGTITDTTYMPGQGKTWSAIITGIFALHFGNFGGDFIRWIYFLLGLMGAFLFYTGNLLWIESRRRKRKRSTPMPQQTRSARCMAAATIGVCWGSVAGVACAMVAGKWLGGLMPDTTNLYLSTYYLVFVAALAWAFFRGAAKAAIHLLWLCGLSILAIPCTAVLAALIPGLPAQLHTAPSLLMIEASAFVIGCAFVYAARKTARHARTTGPDSVWHTIS